MHELSLFYLYMWLTSLSIPCEIPGELFNTVFYINFFPSFNWGFRFTLGWEIILSDSSSSSWCWGKEGQSCLTGWEEVNVHYFTSFTYEMFFFMGKVGKKVSLGAYSPYSATTTDKHPLPFFFLCDQECSQLYTFWSWLGESGAYRPVWYNNPHTVLYNCFLFMGPFRARAQGLQPPLYV